MKQATLDSEGEVERMSNPAKASSEPKDKSLEAFIEEYCFPLNEEYKTKAKTAIESLVANRVAEARRLERNRIRTYLWKRGIKINLNNVRLNKTRPKVEKKEIENLDMAIKSTEGKK